MHVRSYDSLAGTFLEEWSGVSVDLLAFGFEGPRQATITLPKGSSHLTAGSLMPHGLGVFLEVDATDESVPWVWVGRATHLSQDSTQGARSVSVKGPEAWLGGETGVQVPAGLVIQGAPGEIVQTVVQSHAEGHHLRIGEVDKGPGVSLALQGGSLWELMTGLAGEYGEEFCITFPGRGVRGELDWRRAAGAVDISREVSLVDGENCEWSCGLDLVGKTWVAAVTVTDTGLWSELVPGYIVGAKWSDDDVGIFDNSRVRIISAAYVPADQAGLSLSVQWMGRHVASN